jgi:thiol-disulfide isomerase/thioredoxin
VKIFFFIFLNLFFLNSYAALSTLKGIDLRVDKTVELKLDKTKPSVYYFLSAWCPCSQASFDHLNDLQRKYKNFNFIGFHSSVAIPKKDALAYFAKFKIDFPIIFDPQVEYADHFKAVKTPHIFVYDKDGEILFQGGATNSRNPKKASKFYLRDALEAYTQKKVIKNKYAKTIGCYIQREK